MTAGDGGPDADRPARPESAEPRLAREAVRDEARRLAADDGDRAEAEAVRAEMDALRPAPAD